MIFSINAMDYSDLSDNDRLNVTLAPLVDRAMEVQQNLTNQAELPPIIEEVL